MKNKWKGATIVLVLIMVGLSGIIFLNPNGMTEIKTLEGESMFFSEDLIDFAMEEYGGSDSFSMCNIPQNKCVLFREIK